MRRNEKNIGITGDGLYLSPIFMEEKNMIIYKNLSEPDQAKLIFMGYYESDVAQIDRAVKETEYSLFEKGESLLEKGRKITAKKARALLGADVFLSGIGRSAFHFTSVRELPDGREILFDSSKMFR